MRALLEFHQDVVSPVSSAFAFSLPCSKALQAMKRHAPTAGVIEMGCGNGLWCACLRREGVPAVAMEIAAPARPFVDVSLGSGAASTSLLAGATDAALFLCWPPLELEQGLIPNLMAHDALAAYGGSVLMYVGEWRGAVGTISKLSDRTADCGQTGGARFQAMVEAEWDLEESIAVPRWPGFADRLYIFTRRPCAPRQHAFEPRHATTGNLQPESLCTAPTAAQSLGDRMRHVLDLGLTDPASVGAALLLDGALLQPG